MTKPQESALICLAFLLQKRFMPLIVGALVDVAAWLWVSLHTGTSMFELLIEFFRAGDVFITRNTPYSGIFTTFIADHSLSLYFSMATGISLAATFGYFYSKHKNAPKIFDSCWAHMISVFWCYSTSSNHYILVLPSIACLYVMIDFCFVLYFELTKESQKKTLPDESA